MLLKFYPNLIVFQSKEWNLNVILIFCFFNQAPPAGIILEAPFYNISQAAKEYIVSPLFLNNPWIIKMGDEALVELNIHFNNAEK